MKICLKKYAKQERNGKVTLNLSDRLPMFISPPCELTCEFQVESQRSYYIIKLNVHGVLSLICQRCLNDFKYEYHNQSNMAVCQTEEDAERLMNSYECIVSLSSEVDLVDIITDELHLFCPEKHEDIVDCGELITNFG